MVARFDLIQWKRSVIPYLYKNSKTNKLYFSFERFNDFNGLEIEVRSDYHASQVQEFLDNNLKNGWRVEGYYYPPVDNS